MPEILDLLQRWNHLEPDRCEVWENRGFHIGEVKGFRIKDAIGNHWCIQVPLEQLSRSLLESTLRGAIEARGLLYRIQNTIEGTHHAVILALETGRYAKGDGSELVLALLKAWVLWLESEKPIDQQGGTP